MHNSKRKTAMELLFYIAWAVVFWTFGTILLLTGVIASGAPVSLLTLLACGALVHVASVYEFGSHMAESDRYGTFRNALSQGWHCAVQRGAIAGLLDLGLTAGLFMAYPLLPDVGLGWAITIMIGIVFLPPYLVLLAIAFWFTRTSRRIESDTHIAS